MADQNDNFDESVLVAHVTVHLVDGKEFELLPFMDANDVKSQVTSLLEEWSKSGFLVRGSQIIPWHQVQGLEATRVEEIPRAEAERRASAWNEQNPAQYQQAFWKTKQPRSKKEKDEDEGGKTSRAA